MERMNSFGNSNIIQPIGYNANDVSKLAEMHINTANKALERCKHEYVKSCIEALIKLRLGLDRRTSIKSYMETSVVTEYEMEKFNFILKVIEPSNYEEPRKTDWIIEALFLATKYFNEGKF